MLSEEGASVTVTMCWWTEEGEAEAVHAFVGGSPEEPGSWGEVSRRSRLAPRLSTSVRAPVSPPSMAQARGVEARAQADVVDGGQGLGTSAVASTSCISLREDTLTGWGVALGLDAQGQGTVPKVPAWLPRDRQQGAASLPGTSGLGPSLKPVLSRPGPR